MFVTPLSVAQRSQRSKSLHSQSHSKSPSLQVLGQRWLSFHGIVNRIKPRDVNLSPHVFPSQWSYPDIYVSSPQSTEAVMPNFSLVTLQLLGKPTLADRYNRKNFLEKVKNWIFK